MANRVIIVLCCVFIAFVACDGGSEDTTPDVEPSEVVQTPAPDPTCPLTGESPPKGVDPARPAVAVKIENSPQARPQHGLEHADLVFEEIVEGGITRFMAIYHCGEAKDAGPVRSARFDDPKLARPFTRVMAYSGSNGFVNKELEKRKMVLLNELNQSTAFYRVPPGTILVHNLFVRTESLRNDKRVRRVDPPRDDVFSFGDAPEDAKKAKIVRINFDASTDIEYKWQSGTWKRYEDGPFLAHSGGQIAVPNVLIQEVEVNTSRKIVDVAGNGSPMIDLKSGGKAFLFRDGKVIPGTWELKDGRSVYRTKAGDDFVFARGPIWVELVPSKKGQVKGSFSFR